MLSELLQQGRFEAEELPSIYAGLAKESRRLAERVERLLSFGRLSRGRLVAHRVETNLTELLRECVEAFDSRHPELPKVEAELVQMVVWVDPSQVRLAVDNYLDNAAKYAPQGGPFRLCLRRQKGNVLISLEDKGEGIRSEDLSRIFRAFERVEDRLSQQVSGNGIGLALVRFVAQAHQGKAWATSELGKGSCFYLSLAAAEKG
jgi:signal transduction histidine kinase